jgi:hypothetical protein
MCCEVHLQSLQEQAMLVHFAQHTVGIASDRMFILISVQTGVTAPIDRNDEPRRRAAAARPFRSGG